VTQYPPDPNSTEAVAANNSPQTALPAGLAQTPTSTGDIQAVPASATNNNQGTNLAPAPFILPPRLPTESNDQYLAKLENVKSQQVNTTAPQLLNKSDA
jgi:hypothetical protein